MKKIELSKIAAVAALISWGAAVSAQNLNPTVEVSRQYEGRLMEVHKPVMTMTLPEDVDKFNLEFDYSVFDKPFRSAYEFSPAMLNINLSPDASGGSKFYLRAGAGYSLHPTLDIVWNPVSKNGFNLSVYGTHGSYIGNYRALSLNADSPDGKITIAQSDNDMFFGYDMLSKAGVTATYDWKKGGAYIDVAYYGMHLKDTCVVRSYDGVDIKAGVFSKGMDSWIYRAGLAYRFAEDKVSGLAGAWMGENDFDLDFTLGKAIKKHNFFLMDMNLDMASYCGAIGALAGNFAIVPKYKFNSGRWNIDAGLRIAFLFRNNYSGQMMNASQGQVFYPDVKVAFNILKQHLDVYLNIDGGPDINKYSSLLAVNHHLTPLYNPSDLPLLDNTDKLVSAVLGFRGNIASRFSYDLKAGYEYYAELPLPTIWFEPSAEPMLGVSVPGSYRSGLTYVSCRNFFARAELGWKSQDVEAGGYFTFTHSNAGKVDPYAFAPAKFTGYFKAVYNWNRRIFAGLDCEFSSCRTGGMSFYSAAEAPQTVAVVVPGYADLGMYLEVAVTRKFSFWGRGGNLLNMTIQKTPLYAESGIYFTAGICLNL